MRGRRLGKTGGVFAGIHGGFFRAENDADGCRSFVAVERSLSDRFLGPDPCLSSVRQNAAVVGHDVRFFIDHTQKKFGVTRPILAQDSASLGQDLLKQRVVSAVKVYEVHRTAEGQRKVFNNGDVSLSRQRRRRRNRDVEVTVVARLICGHRPKQNGQDHRRVTSYHVLDLLIEIRSLGWLLQLHASEYHECLKAARQCESTGLTAPPLN
jgi:hypothetical protein